MKSTATMKKLLYLYLLAQGIGGILWWILLLKIPESRSLFLSELLPESVLTAFWLPDLFIFIIGSLVTAHGLKKDRAWFRPLSYFLTGGIAYVSFYCLALSLATQGGWLGTVIMLFCLIVMVFICYEVKSDGRPDDESVNSF